MRWISCQSPALRPTQVQTWDAELIEVCLPSLLLLVQAAGTLNPVQKVDLKGWMFKKGARKTDGFKKRWFELRGSQLAYFVGPGKASPLQRC